MGSSGYCRKPPFSISVSSLLKTKPEKNIKFIRPSIDSYKINFIITTQELSGIENISELWRVLDKSTL